MNGLRSAVAFLTVLPPGRGPFDPATAVRWYAPVGVVLAVLLGSAGAGAAELWPGFAAAAFVVVTCAAITGALHLDGLADAADAAFAPVDRPRRLAILRDVHHGTFAVVTVAAVLLLKTGALSGLGSLATAAAVGGAVVAGRAVLAPVIRAFAPARPDGMGASARAGATRPTVVVSALFAPAAGLLTAGWQGGLAGAGAIVLALAIASWLAGRFGGLTGDCYGAIVETIETAWLLALGLLFARGWAEPFPWWPS